MSAESSVAPSKARFSAAAKSFLVGSALMGAAWALPWSLLSLYLDRRGFSKEDIGRVVACDAWGKVLIAIPAAFVLARRATRPLLLAASIASGVAYVLLPRMESLHALMACNLLAGLAWSVHFVAIAPFLYRNSGPGERARLFGWAEAVHTAAAVGGAWGGAQLLRWLASRSTSETTSLAWTLELAGVLALAAAVPYAGIAEPRVEERARPPRPHAVLWRERWTLARFAVPQLCIALGAGLVISFLGLYFQDRFGFSPDDVSTLNAVGWLLMTAGYLITPFCLRRFGFVRSVVLLELLSIPFFLVLAFAFDVRVAVAAFFLRGVLMNGATPLLKNFSMHATPEDARALQNGVSSLMSGVGWAIGPHLGGWMLDKSTDNYRVLMCTTVAFYVLAATSTWLLLRGVEGRRAQPK